MTFEGPCWLSASTDGTRIVYKTMEPGSTQVLKASREIEIRVGDAGAVALTVNGRAQAPLGGPGEVRNVVLTPGSAPDHQVAGRCGLLRPALENSARRGERSPVQFPRSLDRHGDSSETPSSRTPRARANTGPCRARRSRAACDARIQARRRALLLHARLERASLAQSQQHTDERDGDGSAGWHRREDVRDSRQSAASRGPSENIGTWPRTRRAHSIRL